MIRIHHQEIEKVETEFIEWILRTYENDICHLLTIRSWLQDEPLYKEIINLPSLTKAIMEDESKSKTDLWIVLDLYKYYIENTFK